MDSDTVHVVDVDSVHVADQGVEDLHSTPSTRIPHVLRSTAVLKAFRRLRATESGTGDDEREAAFGIQADGRGS